MNPKRPSTSLFLASTAIVTLLAGCGADEDEPAVKSGTEALSEKSKSQHPALPSDSDSTPSSRRQTRDTAESPASAASTTSPAPSALDVFRELPDVHIEAIDEDGGLYLSLYKVTSDDIPFERLSEIEELKHLHMPHGATDDMFSSLLQK